MRWPWALARRGAAGSGRPYSLRQRLVLAIVGSTAVCWLVGLALIVGSAWNETSDMFDDSLEEGARLVAVLSASMRELGELASDLEIPESTGRQRVRLYYQVVDENGTMLRRSRHVPDTPFIDHLDGQREFYNAWLDGRAWRVYVLRVPEQGFLVQMAQPWQDRTDLLGKMASGLAWPALALLLLLGGINWLVIRRLFRPLERLAAEIRAKSPDDLSPVGAVRADELRAMTEALNGVLARLAQALHRERRFTADAAHELRTPLAALRMKIQLMQRLAPQADSTPRLQELRADVDRCTALVENLLALARLDPQQPGTLARQALDAQALVQGAIDDCTAMLRERGIRLSTDVGVARIDGHPGLLRSAVRNLVDNAVRYGRVGGRVVVEVAPVHGIDAAGGERRVRIAVRDDGPGASEEDRARLTQRFFRALGSGVSGSGLGLSIVQRIMELHGGLVRVEDGLSAEAEGEGGPGLSVVLEWPQPQG